MFASLDRAAETLKGLLADLDPGCFGALDAARAVDAFAEVERLAAAGKALFARRVEETNLWRREGHRSAAAWMAARTGVTSIQAAEALGTARRLEGLPQVAEAFRDGRLSETQAREISSAASADPAAEHRLVEAATSATAGELREQCRRVKAAATDGVEQSERLHRSRCLRHWTEASGAFRLDARLTPEDGAVVAAALAARVKPIFKEARAAGRREPFEAYAADALVELCRHPDGPRATVEVRVDAAALRRGHLEAGELCEVPGVGPIPVAAARSLAGDGFVKAVVTNGADVAAVSHLGRTIHARLRSALVARDPTCVVPGCGARHGLEIDHLVPFAEGGPTALDNLARLCRHHHFQKTHLGYRLTGGPGRWSWEGPGGPEPGDLELRAPP